MSKEIYRQLKFTLEGNIIVDHHRREMTSEEIQEYEHMTEDLDQITIFDYLNSLDAKENLK